MKAKNQIQITQLLGNIVVHIRAKYRRNRTKTLEAYLIWKKYWRSANGRAMDWRTGDDELLGIR